VKKVNNTNVRKYCIQFLVFFPHSRFHPSPSLSTTLLLVNFSHKVSFYPLLAFHHSLVLRKVWRKIIQRIYLITYTMKVYKELFNFRLKCIHSFNYLISHLIIMPYFLLTYAANDDIHTFAGGFSTAVSR